MIPPYPGEAHLRDQWILALRPPRKPTKVNARHTFLVEDERCAAGEVVPVATIFLTNRECPYHCVFCDLWKQTVPDQKLSGGIPEQIRLALSLLPKAAQLKLYNSGSFFDPHAISVSDYEAIAGHMEKFECVVVESHPAFVGDNTLRLKDLLRGHLEVAMGLETAHPESLEKLNKRMTLERFSQAAEVLRKNEISLRVFLLVHPPFVKREEVMDWLRRSLNYAFDAGATVVSLIPTRPGNGALEALAQEGLYRPPRLTELEEALALGISLGRGRVFADLWDLATFSHCDKCYPARSLRLRRMNHTQTVEKRSLCPLCGE